MSGYTRNISEAYEFDGDKITIKLKRLSRDSMMNILPHMDMDSEGKVVMTPEKAIKFIGTVADTIKPYIIEVEGLKVEGESACPARNAELFDEIYASSYFSSLWTQVAFTLIQQSSVSEDDKEKGETEKKLEKQSSATSEELGEDKEALPLEESQE